jgi:paraquat-inducible protein A
MKAATRAPVPTAAAAGLASCHACGLLSRLPAAVQDGEPARQPAACPRCGAHLHTRLPASVARTWAYVLAAAILYIPANVMPVMTSDSLFGEQDDTILSGVWFLWQDGSWFLAALVFFASIAVPLAKLAALAWLLAGVQLRWAGQPLWRARVYRTIEFLGRWSMLDIYVVTLLAGLVQVQSLATIHAGPGAVAFGAVVVLTMLASRSFDPRLIWDAQAAARQLQPAESPRPIET